MKMLHEFRQFIQRGNVVDLAVGVIMGTAFGKIVTSLVGDVLMPPIGYLVGGVAFTELKWELPAIELLHTKAASIKYGSFLQASFDFLITAFCVFLIVKGMNTLSRKPDPTPPPPTPSEKLLIEIRDLLKQQNETAEPPAAT